MPNSTTPSTESSPPTWRQLAWRVDGWLLAGVLVLSPWLYGAVRADVLRWLVLLVAAALVLAMFACLRDTRRRQDQAGCPAINMAAGLLLAAVLWGAALDDRADDAEAHRQLANLRIQLYRQGVVELLRQDESLAALDRTTLWRFSSPLQVHGRAHAFARVGSAEGLQLLREDQLVQEQLLPALRHAMLARQACPMLPRVHLQIAQLCVLVETPAEDEVHVQRVERLAPGNPGLLFMCGLLHLNAERREQAYACWQASLRLSPRYQAQIMTAAEGRVLPEAIVEHVLPPVPQQLVQMADKYFSLPQQRPLFERVLQRALAALPETPADLADVYALRGRIYDKLARPAEAIGQYEQAVQRASSDLGSRYQLARLLLAEGDTERAREHARWCARMQPDARNYRELLIKIHQTRLRRDE